MNKYISDRTKVHAPDGRLVIDFRHHKPIIAQLVADILNDETENDETERLRTGIREKAVAAIAIMDERGRWNPEGNSVMLWETYWDDVRTLLVEIAEGAKDEGGKP